MRALPPALGTSPLSRAQPLTKYPERSEWARSAADRALRLEKHKQGGVSFPCMGHKFLPSPNVFFHLGIAKHAVSRAGISLSSSVLVLGRAVCDCHHPVQYWVGQNPPIIQSRKPHFNSLFGWISYPPHSTTPWQRPQGIHIRSACRASG